MKKKKVERHAPTMKKLSSTPNDSEVDDDRLETHQTTVDQTAPFLEMAGIISSSLF
jgi:hypothetical protein